MQGESRSTRQPYFDSWGDYRRRVRLFYGSWLGGLLLPFLFTATFARVLGPVFPILGYVLGFAWLVAIVVSGVRLAAWRCPHCHNWFFARRLDRNPFARACLHCGLPKWAAGPQPHSGGYK